MKAFENEEVLQVVFAERYGQHPDRLQYLNRSDTVVRGQYEDAAVCHWLQPKGSSRFTNKVSLWLYYRQVNAVRSGKNYLTAAEVERYNDLMFSFVFLYRDPTDEQLFSNIVYSLKQFGQSIDEARIRQQVSELHSMGRNVAQWLHEAADYQNGKAQHGTTDPIFDPTFRLTPKNCTDFDTLQLHIQEAPKTPAVVTVDNVPTDSSLSFIAPNFIVNALQPTTQQVEQWFSQLSERAQSELGRPQNAANYNEDSYFGLYVAEGMKYLIERFNDIVIRHAADPANVSADFVAQHGTFFVSDSEFAERIFNRQHSKLTAKQKFTAVVVRKRITERLFVFRLPSSAYQEGQPSCRAVKFADLQTADTVNGVSGFFVHLPAYMRVIAAQLFTSLPDNYMTRYEGKTTPTAHKLPLLGAKTRPNDYRLKTALKDIAAELYLSKQPVIQREQIQSTLKGWSGAEGAVKSYSLDEDDILTVMFNEFFYRHTADRAGFLNDEAVLQLTDSDSHHEAEAPRRRGRPKGAKDKQKRHTAKRS